MRLAGMYDKDADYGGMIPQAVMGMVKAHAKQGHSGGSHWITMKIFNQVINFKTLTPITSNPSEWNEVSTNFWQSNRQSDAFSSDGGKSWYFLDEPGRPIHTEASDQAASDAAEKQAVGTT